MCYLVNQKTLNKEERLQVIEEKLKSMENVLLTSHSRQTYKGGKIDMEFKQYYSNTNKDLQPQSRRPKALSKAYARMKEIRGDDFESQPYDNFLGGK